MRPVIYPADWLFRAEVPTLNSFSRRFLAEGDSWFTLGTLNLPEASNILNKLEFSATTVIVSCAYPGDTLQHMVDSFHDPYFDRLLRRRNFASYWEALLLSAGGNDLIDAAQHRAIDKNGKSVGTAERILLTPEEAATVNAGIVGPERFISSDGWARLESYLLANFKELAKRRSLGPSRDRPIFLHTYHVPIVRPSGTIGSPDGWLHAAFKAYALPASERQGLTDILFDRLRKILLSLDSDSGSPSSLPKFHVFDSATLVNLLPAASDATGISGDWVNEIHPTPGGYAKIGEAMGPWIDEKLKRYP